MANEDIQNEMALLREELEALKKEREAEKTCASSENNDQATEEPAETLSNNTATKDTDTNNETTSEDLAIQFKSLIESIDKDINETKPVTLLAVFALGVLVGRL